MAAVVATQSDLMLRRELQIPELEECSVFRTDCTTMLRYFRNESKSFQTFVANRVQKVRKVCEPSQWRHIPSKENPADPLPKGLSVNEFLECSLWKNGPPFLLELDNWLLPLQDLKTPADLANDPEVRKNHIVTCAVNVETNF